MPNTKTKNGHFFDVSLTVTLSSGRVVSVSCLTYCDINRVPRLQEQTASACHYYLRQRLFGVEFNEIESNPGVPCIGDSSAALSCALMALLIQTYL